MFSGGWKRFHQWMALFGNGYVASVPSGGNTFLLENNSGSILLEDGSSYLTQEV